MYATFKSNCPKTCGGCKGTNGAGTKPGPQPTPAPKPPTPPVKPGSVCCRGTCSGRGSKDCAAGLFCCPGHKMCMDRTTSSTRGKNCDICKNGGKPLPTPAPTPPPKPPPAGSKSCEFEKSEKTYCGIWKEAAGDKMNWKRGTRTPSYRTGPDKAKSGNFLYIECSGCRRKAGENAILETNAKLGSGASLNFDYNMNGRSIGSLSVKADGKEVWVEKGNKGSAWKHAAVDLSKFAGKSVKLQFEAKRGNGWAGDIAIDSVALFEGKSGGAPAPTQAPPTGWPMPTTAAPPSPSPSPSPAPAPATTGAPTSPSPSPSPAPAP